VEKFTYFWNKRSPYSQWYPSRFSALVLVNPEMTANVNFNRAEKFMMYKKAILFGDFKTAIQILETDDPAKQKALGREVKNFDQTKWDMEARDIVYCGNLYKFSQNSKLKQLLIATAGTTLVEASPFDTIWGIGLRESDPRAHNRDTWLGTNWLGQVLTNVREELMKK
jgi:ribA/ribD-fused uncharacterized protein